MLEISVKNNSPAAISAAIKKIREMVMTGAVSKTTPVHVTIEAGTYRETVKYNLSNPLIMEGPAGAKADSCEILADNCEAYKAGLENRAIFVVGPNATEVTLKNFSIRNTHNKSANDKNTLADCAEAFVWNNEKGRLYAEGLKIYGRQNTLFVKGSSYFKNCCIEGDKDFIYGEVELALFEECQINLIEDNRGDFEAAAIKSGALAEKPGYVFLNSIFKCTKRKHNKVFVCRTEGKASPETKNNWDNITFINCLFDEHYDEELISDDDMNLEIFPRGNSKSGIREYNSKVLKENKSVENADTVNRNVKCYKLTDEDYFKSYASRYLILKDTVFADLF